MFWLSCLFKVQRRLLFEPCARDHGEPEGHARSPHPQAEVAPALEHLRVPVGAHRAATEVLGEAEAG